MPTRVAHYLNQFFAGRGGEEAAETPPDSLGEPVGPGRLLQSHLGSEGRVVATLFCGDNHFAEHEAGARARIAEILAELKPDVLVAGPAFGSGRYGMACGAVCQVAAGLGIPAVTGMYPENPGVDVYRREVLIVPTAVNAAGMDAALSRLAGLALRLAVGAELGPADAEGYLPRFRRNRFDPRTGAERAVAMLCDRLHGRPFHTELELPAFDSVPPAAPVADLGRACLALVTTSGVVPDGNPDRIESWRASRWARYSLEGLERLPARDYTCVHGGFDNRYIREDPNRAVPLDALRELEREGRLGRLHPDLYVTVGNVEPVDRARRFGREIAASLRSEGVDAVLLTAT